MGFLEAAQPHIDAWREMQRRREVDPARLGEIVRFLESTHDQVRMATEAEDYTAETQALIGMILGVARALADDGEN